MNENTINAFCIGIVLGVILAVTIAVISTNGMNDELIKRGIMEYESKTGELIWVMDK